MRVSELGALAVLARAAEGASTRVGRAQAPDLECTQLANLPEDGAPFAAGLKALDSKKIDASQAETGCRSALRADPANPTLMFRLGRALSLGDKRLEAIKYYLDAADRGHAGAMNDLGGVFEYGLGVPKNLATALVWYERAAELGHAGAMTHMGRLSEHGRDVPQDFANARRWYEKAAAVGHAAAMSNLADLLRYGRGVAPDLPAAASWYLKAAQRGLASAMNSLGELSEGGAGVPQNDQTARSWYKKAADLGDADAMGNLGALLESGRGGPQMLETAESGTSRRCSQRPSRDAQSRLDARERSRDIAEPGGSQNLVRARGSAGISARAQRSRASVLAGAGVPKSHALAKSSFERAAKLGDAKAMNNLGMLYLNGTGCKGISSSPGPGSNGRPPSTMRKQRRPSSVSKNRHRWTAPRSPRVARPACRPAERITDRT
jgi:TPR repeat protein